MKRLVQGVDNRHGLWARVSAVDVETDVGVDREHERDESKLVVNDVGVDVSWHLYDYHTVAAHETYVNHVCVQLHSLHGVFRPKGRFPEDRAMIIPRLEVGPTFNHRGKVNEPEG